MEPVNSIERSLSRIQPYKKILLLGNDDSGKSQLFNLWVNKPLMHQPNPWSDEEFCTTAILSEKCRLNLQIWNIPENKTTFSASYANSDLIVIVLSANCDFTEKMNQIAKWLASLEKDKLNHIPVALIETTLNLDNLATFTKTDAGEMGKKFVFHIPFSFNASSNSVEHLNKQIVSLLPITIIQPTPQITPLPYTDIPKNVIKDEIVKLSAEKSKDLLQSLMYLLLLGPINEAGHHYQLRLFSGMPITLNGNTYNYKVPFNVFRWLNNINTSLQLTAVHHTSTLFDILDTLEPLTDQKPWDRYSSTHDFYKNSLLNFIRYVVCSHNKKDEELNYFTIRRKISELHRNSVNLILNWLSEYLLAGPFPERDTHYDLGFWGGKTYASSNSSRSSKVPSHVAALLNFISNIDQAKDNQSSLMVALDYTISIGYSMSPDRKESTQNFYSRLTSVLIGKIDDIYRSSYQKRMSFGTK